MQETAPAITTTGLPRWFSVKHGKDVMKRGWIKLHSIVDISTRVILNYNITDTHTSDIKGMLSMIENLPAIGNGRLFCLDKAYLARQICDMIAQRGWIPRIMPKSNTVYKNNGSQAWGDMLRTYRDQQELFLDEYHQRSIIEAVFGAIKKMYGDQLRSRIFERQKRDVTIRIICYNIELVARSQVESGRLTHESLAAMAV